MAVLMMNLACALEIDINIKESFVKGEEISFEYTISSESDIEIEYTAYVLCEDAPQALLEKKSVNISPDIPYNELYTDFTVTEDISPQICKAGVTVSEPISVTEEKTFEITTNPQVDLIVSLSNKVFVKGENIEINYFSNNNPAIQAELTYPSGRKEQITLPATIKAEETGNYELRVEASEEGYDSVISMEQFGVIEEKAVVQDVSVCNGDGICDSGENSNNCPQDCEKTALSWQLLIILLVIGILLVVVVYLILKKRK